MRRGSSQATFIIEDENVRKSDSPVTGRRVRDQGIWLRKYDESLCLPAVHEVYADGYLMEKLGDGGLYFDYPDLLKLCKRIIATLEDKLWNLEFENVLRTLVEYNEDPSSMDLFESNPCHRHYVKQLLRDVNLIRSLGKTMSRYEDRINWRHLRRGLTHGDPIYDNVMYRPKPEWQKGSHQLVLIDPIPATPAIPDVLAVDVGRVIQSAVGYEELRYVNLGNIPSWPRVNTTKRTHDAVNFVLNNFMPDEFTLNDARASVYFAIIHMMRGVRSAQKVAPARVPALRDAVIHLVAEAESWMR